MATGQSAVELPADVVARLGAAEFADATAREALLLGLLRDGILSQGQAAYGLGVTRWQLLDLMARDAVPSGPETAGEMRREIEDARRQHRS